MSLGQGIAQAVGAGIIALLVLAVVAGGGLLLLAQYLYRHISIQWVK